MRFVSGIRKEYNIAHQAMLDTKGHIVSHNYVSGKSKILTQEIMFVLGKKE
jgi:hypothetical protein